jgi:hypothetical protein
MFLVQRPRLLAVLALALSVASTPLFASSHKIPKPKEAATYPCHAVHPNEHVTIAAEPYDTPEKGKLFRVDYLENGFMPIYLVVTNNGDHPISLDQARIDFLSAHDDRIPAAVPRDVERRMTHIHGPGARIPLPAPLPPLRKKPKSPDKKIEQDFNDLEYSDATVLPHSTRAGFFFYDVQGLGDHPLKGGHLTLRDLRDSSGNPLVDFDIPFDKCF